MMELVREIISAHQRKLLQQEETKMRFNEFQKAIVKDLTLPALQRGEPEDIRSFIEGYIGKELDNLARLAHAVGTDLDTCASLRLQRLAQETKEAVDPGKP